MRSENIILTTRKCHLGLPPSYQAVVHQVQQSFLEALDVLGLPISSPYRAKPLWWHSPPAVPHSATPASPSSPRLLTFPLAGNDCHLENIFPPTWFQRGLQTERQELSGDCSALWGEASRRLQGALEPRRSPTHQPCSGTGLPARAWAPGTHSCMQSTPPGEISPDWSRKPQAPVLLESPGGAASQ